MSIKSQLFLYICWLWLAITMHLSDPWLSKILITHSFMDCSMQHGCPRSPNCLRCINQRAREPQRETTQLSFPNRFFMPPSTGASGMGSGKNLHKAHCILWMKYFTISDRNTLFVLIDSLKGNLESPRKHA